MEKFIECLKARAYALATKELDSEANCFGFARRVPEIAQAIEDAQVGEEAYNFSVAFVLAMAQRYPDGRDEKSIGLAKKLIASGLGLEEGQEGILKEVSLRVVRGSMHPTVMQQAAQLAFYILDSNGAVPEELKEDSAWWRMPLI